MSQREEKMPNIIKSPTRNLTGAWNKISKVIAITMSLIALYTAAFGTFPTYFQRSIHLIFVLVLTFLLYPFKRYEKDQVKISDVILIIFSLLSLGWVLINNQRFTTRFAYVDPLHLLDYVFCILLILVLLEANRRTMGWPLVMTTIVTIIYNFFGHYIPGYFSAPKCTLEYFTNHIYMSTEGILGNVVGLSSTYIIMFVIFGAFVDSAGMGKLFIDLSNALTGKQPGGPAKTAVIASGMFGSISGSGVANVVTTGVFTIPAMKRAGYSPEEAGAVEAVASCGGQLLPPVMGSAVFLMVSFVGISYLEIVKVSIIPGLMYFALVYLFVDLIARRKGMKGISQMEIIPLPKLLRENGYLLVPIIALVILIVRGYTPFYAAFICIVLMVLVSFFRRETSFTLSKIMVALEHGSKNMVAMGSAAGCVGIIMGIVTLTGVGVRMSSLILRLSQHNLLLTIILVAIIAYILGMGLNVTSAYIIGSVLTAPSLVEVGVPLLVAHLLVFWFCQTSNVTPPVCMAAYAASIISGGNAMLTGLKSAKMSIGMIIIPFLFVYSPIIFTLHNTNLLEFLWFLITSILSLALLAVTLEGFVTKHIKIIGRILTGIASLFLFLPNVYSKLFGLFVLLLFLLFYKKVTYINKKYYIK
ncbi:MAG: TRAP-T family transporter, fused inner membrane subunit [Parcubacteria bacterium 34_609]|nr:MAG: TRAP-T family transporter, fused inner membrane subunit [Parcubacteria bacterium 34_609]